METSILLAKVFGLTFLLFTLGILFNKNYYAKVFNDIYDAPLLYLYGGMAAFVAGFFMVNAHNVWVKDWPVLITILAWLTLIKGIMLIVRPTCIKHWSKSMLKNKKMMPVMIAVSLVLGVALSYFGFTA